MVEKGTHRKVGSFLTVSYSGCIIRCETAKNHKEPEVSSLPAGFVPMGDDLKMYEEVICDPDSIVARLRAENRLEWVVMMYAAFQVNDCNRLAGSLWKSLSEEEQVELLSLRHLVDDAVYEGTVLPDEVHTAVFVMMSLVGKRRVPLPDSRVLRNRMEAISYGSLFLLPYVGALSNVLGGEGGSHWTAREVILRSLNSFRAVPEQIEDWAKSVGFWETYPALISACFYEHSTLHFSVDAIVRASLRSAEAEGRTPSEVLLGVFADIPTEVASLAA